jgi:glycosyltransferase involved in cell wall biosynthesis
VKKVSILILTFNRLQTTEKYVPLIIDRIGNIDAEVLIWDNGSSDGTYDWLENYKVADCRVSRTFGTEENYGLEAINFLAERAKGEYILKIDDDVFPPCNFAKRLVNAYEELSEEKLIFLGWDMAWNGKTFATRSGLRLYKKPYGKTVALKNGDRIYISFDNHPWLMNGICRLSPTKKFLEIGGHPKGVKYGVDYLVTKTAKRQGYWIGYFSTNDLVQHMSPQDTLAYRTFKNEQLQNNGAPLHV